MIALRPDWGDVLPPFGLALRGQRALARKLDALTANLLRYARPPPRPTLPPGLDFGKVHEAGEALGTVRAFLAAFPKGARDAPPGLPGADVDALAAWIARALAREPTRLDFRRYALRRLCAFYSDAGGVTLNPAGETPAALTAFVAGYGKATTTAIRAAVRAGEPGAQALLRVWNLPEHRGQTRPALKYRKAEYFGQEVASDS